MQEHDLHKHLKENILTFLEGNSWVWEFFYLLALPATCLFKSHTKKPASKGKQITDTCKRRHLWQSCILQLPHSVSEADEYCFLFNISLVIGYICICINYRHWKTVFPHVSYFSPFGLVLFSKKRRNTWGELVKRKPEKSTQKCHIFLRLCKQTHKVSDSGKSE